MKLKFDSKGDFNKALSWLSRVANGTPTKALKMIAQAGVESLAANTPKDTGETASGWFSEIDAKKGVSEVIWKNRAHPEAKVNVAKLIDIGHGTRNGGYVPPNPYIEASMDSVWKKAGELVTEEMIGK